MPASHGGRGAGRRAGERLTCVAAVVALGLAVGAVVVACDREERSLKRPNVAALDGRGELHVSDLMHGRIVVFDETGRFLRKYGRKGLGHGELWHVQGLFAADEPGGMWVVNHHIRAASDHTMLWEVKLFVDGAERAAFPLDVPGKEGGQWIEGLARGPNGSYFAVDSELDQVLHYDADWKYLGAWDGTTDGMAFDGVSTIQGKSGEIWLAEQSSHRIRRVTLDGTPLGVFGKRGSEPGELRFPQDLDVCTGKWVAVADLGNYRVQRYDLEGRFLDGFEPAPATADGVLQLMDITVSASCDRLYLVDSKGGRVLVTTPTGQPVASIARW